MANDLSPNESQELAIRERLNQGIPEDEELKLREQLYQLQTTGPQKAYGKAVAFQPIVEGIGRGVKDLREAFTQASTGAGPGEVYGQRSFHPTPGGDTANAEDIKPERAIEIIEQFNNRKLTPEERQAVLQDPAMQLQMTRYFANRNAAHEREQFSKEAGPGAQVIRAATNVLPSMLVRTPAAIARVPGLGGWLARTLFSGGVGAAAGGTQFVEQNQTRGENAGLGAAAGAGFGGVTEGLRNLLPAKDLATKAHIRDKLGEPGTADFIEQGRKLQQEIPGLRLSASALGLGEGAAQAEREVAGHLPVRAAQFQENNTRALIDYVRKNVSDKTEASLPGATSDAIKRIRGARADDFASALEEAKQAGGALDTGDVKQGIVDRIRELKGLKGAGDRAELSQLASFLRMLPKDNKLQTRQVQSILEDLSDRANSKTGIIGNVESAPVENGRRRAAANALNLFNDALKGSEEAGPKLLQDARTKYADVSDALREIKATRYGSVIDSLTKKGAPLSADKLKASWRLSSPEEKQVILRYIGDDESVLPTLRHEWLDDLLSKSEKPLGAAPGRGVKDESGKLRAIDLDEMLSTWKDDKNFDLLFRNNPEMKRKMLMARDALERLAPRGRPQSAQGVIGGSVEGTRSVTGMLTSQSGSNIFLAGATMRRLYPGVIQKLLTTDKGIEALIKAANPRSYNASEVSAAVAYLNKLQAEQGMEPDSVGQPPPLKESEKRTNGNKIQ